MPLRYVLVWVTGHDYRGLGFEGGEDVPEEGWVGYEDGVSVDVDAFLYGWGDDFVDEEFHESGYWGDLK